LCDGTHPFGFDDSSGESPKSGDVFRAVAGTYPTAIFIVIPIDNVMAAILDAPMAAVHGENTLWIGLLRRSTGNAIGEITGSFAGLFLYGMSFDDERLSNVRKIEVVIEFGCGPDLSGFDSPMVRRIKSNEIGLLTVLKVQLNVLKESELVSFDGEVIMGLTILYQIAGYLALGQQGISRDVLSLNVDSIKQRDGNLDFIGTFDFFSVFYRQGTDFFWV